MFINGKARNMPKVSKLCTEEVYNLHVSAFKYSLRITLQGPKSVAESRQQRETFWEEACRWGVAQEANFFLHENLLKCIHWL